nr:zinc finger, CCHC-type [Tanacetum cinerariifolium]
MVRSMMSQTTLPKSFWDYVLETTARILNLVLTKKVEKTPYEVWHGKAPKLSNLKVCGYEALVKHDTLTKPDKLEPRSIKCIFIGYLKETMIYSFYYPLENKMDVKTAFLNRYLNEKVYMEQPKGFINPKYPNRRYYMVNSNHGSIAMQEKLKLSKSQGASTPAEVKRMQNVSYASAVGFIIGDLKGELRVSYYTDAGYLTDADDLKSQTGYVFVLNGEAEYIATFDASKEAVWVRKFISGLGVVPTIKEPISMYYDNTGAIAIAN